MTNPLAYGLYAAVLITAAVGLAAAVRWCVGELRRGKRGRKVGT